MEVALASRTREREHPVDIDGAVVDQSGDSPRPGLLVAPRRSGLACK